ncbi:GNAT family N-acetyltransferase [Kribbella sp. NBC_01505]|uniref:GNAT family N-acetyltransferase n=1 Tax=Kribbella sp. NBC_01505 TaxID=2903580 RepID=UPI0038685201
MEIGVRIARAQLSGLARSRRQVIVGPLVAMLHDEEAWYLSTMLAAEPGTPFEPEEIPESLAIVRKAFAAEGRWLSAEIVEEASPGLADLLVANGMTIAARRPLLLVEPEDLLVTKLPTGVTVELIGSDAERAEANAVAADAYETEDVEFKYQPVLADGGAVLVRVDGVAVATAAWTAVADGVTEVAGVGTIHSYRRQGLAGIATAYATQFAFEQAGASLAWLTPGDDGADRVYRRVGYAPQATAVHLGDPGGHLDALR